MDRNTLNKPIRILSLAIAASVAFAPLANAQPQHNNGRPTQQKIQPNKQLQLSAHKKGQKLPNWKRQPSVDYKRHGLKRPGTGQQWVKVDNQYLLVNLATGLILGMTAAR